MEAETYAVSVCQMHPDVCMENTQEAFDNILK